MNYINCSVGRYHNFRVNESLYKNGGTVQVETCAYCREQKRYGFRPDGEMENSRQYFLDHIRAFAQESSQDVGMQAAFLYCNPNGVARLAKDRKIEEKSIEFQAEMKDRFRFVIKKALNNEGWKDKTADGIDRSSSEK